MERIAIAVAGFIAGAFTAKQFYLGTFRAARKERQQAHVLLAQSANILHETQKTIERVADEIQAEREEEEEE